MSDTPSCKAIAGPWSRLGWVAAGLLATCLGLIPAEPAWAGAAEPEAQAALLPAEAWMLSAGSRYLAGLDVGRLVASQFYRRYVVTGLAARPQAFIDLRNRLGVNPERDLDQLWLVGGATGEPALTLAAGRFDLSAIHRTIRRGQPAAVQKTMAGQAVFVFEQPPKATLAVALLDQRHLALGTPQALDEFLGNRAQHRPALRGNAWLVALVERLKPGRAFWFAGDRSALTQIPLRGNPAFPMDLPQLKQLTLTADLDELLAVDVDADAVDEAAAKNVADMVRALTMLAALPNPALKTLPQAVQITTDRTQLHLTARVPYDLLDVLMKPPKPAAPQARPQKPVGSGASPRPSLPR